MRYQGVVKSYNKEKGYGFIKYKSETEMFFHVSEVLGLITQPLVDKVVSFEIFDEGNRPKATKIHLVDYIELNEVLIKHLELFNKEYLNMLSKDQISLSEFIEQEISLRNSYIVEFLSKMPNGKIDPILRNSSIIRNHLFDYTREQSHLNKYSNTYLFDRIARKFLNHTEETAINIVGPGGSGKTELLYRLLYDDSILITLSNGEKVKDNNQKNQRIFTLTQLLLKANEIMFFDKLYYDTLSIFRDSQMKSYEAKRILSQLEPYLSNLDFTRISEICDLYFRKRTLNQHDLDSVYNILSNIKIKKYFTDEAEKRIINKYKDDPFIDQINEDQIYNKMFENREVTYKSLVHLFIKEKLTLDFLSKTTLLIDDVNTFGPNDWIIINKILKIVPRHVFTYDTFFMAYQFTKNILPFEQYKDDYRPTVLYITQNMRSVKPIVSKINHIIESNWGLKNQTFSLSENQIFIEKRISFFGWLQNLKNTNVCIVLRKNQDLNDLEEYLIKYGLSYTRLDRNFFDTVEGEKYVFLFKYILTKNPSTKFTQNIKERFLVNFVFDLKNILSYDRSSKHKEMINVNITNGQDLIYILEFILNETGKDSVKEALQEFLENQHQYPYYRTHYYKEVYSSEINIYLSTFHRLKQVKEFDYVIFPLTTYIGNTSEEKSLSYTALSKSKQGYGLFDFQTVGLKYMIIKDNELQVIDYFAEVHFSNFNLHDVKDKNEICYTINYIDEDDVSNEINSYKNYMASEDDLPF